MGNGLQDSSERATPLGSHLRKFREQSESRRRYWQALGHFVDAFAHTEVALQMMLWALARVEVDVARAVFSGVRTDQSVSFINRILEAKGNSKAKRSVARYFQQLSILTRARNDILHYGGHWAEIDKFKVSNATAAHTAEKYRETLFSITDIENMAFDLQQIRRAFQVVAWDGVEPENLDRMSDDEIRREPWRYAPPPSRKGITPAK